MADYSTYNNFELMAMQIEKSGINLAAIYRPLNNIFLNKIMERLRIKYICKKQIKKGRSGTRDLLKSFKKNYSIALMIDQRVSEGIKCDFFGQPALTTTIPAQLFKKFGCKIVPIYNALDLYAKEKARLRKGGTIVDDFDLLIGVTAVVNKMTLVTNNTKHFGRIRKILLEDWTI